MNTQEIIERDVRLLIGDLHLQLIMARAQIAELQQQPADMPSKPNGKDKDHQPGEEAHAP